jgi:hypothetical protein
MANKIISVEYQIPGFAENYYEYNSDQSLLDAEIIVFKPQTFSYSASTKASFGDDDSFKVVKNSKHWQTELSVALEYGKTVFLILGQHQIASIRTGKTEVKGRTHINYVTDYDNYQFLPLELPSMTSKGGASSYSRAIQFSHYFGKTLAIR